MLSRLELYLRAFSTPAPLGGSRWAETTVHEYYAWKPVVSKAILQDFGHQISGTIGSRAIAQSGHSSSWIESRIPGSNSSEYSVNN